MHLPPPDLEGEVRSLIGHYTFLRQATRFHELLVDADTLKHQSINKHGKITNPIDDQALRVYGITVRQVGLERLTLPTATLTATIDRMRAERATVAAQRAAEGQRLAAQIQSDADRDSRVLVAQGKAAVADIEAKSRIQAAGIYKNAYAADPQLYTMLRSLDSLNSIVGANTTLILRTDAAPFRALVEGPAAPAAGKGK